MTDLAETLLTGILTGLAADALWESGKWAWKNRGDIRNRLGRIPKPITVAMNPANLAAKAHKVTVSDTLGITDNALTTVSKDLELQWNVLSTVGKNLHLVWNVEAATPSLARRLEDLAAWYLHVS
jgi:hypothetical protein